MLRRLTLVGVAFLATVLFAAGSGGSAIRSTFYAGDFLGEWTPGSTTLQGQPFTISISDEATARSASGANSINYDVYCKSGNAGVGSATYYTLRYTWDGGGSMGGCHSGKTSTHIYLWGPSSVAYFQLATVNDEEVLDSHWGPQNGGTVNYLAFTAHHPLVKFLTHLKYSVAGKKGGSVAELYTATGVGSVRVAETPVNCLTTPVLDAAGALALEVVRIGGPSIVELDKVTVELDAKGTYKQCDTQEYLSKIPVTVTKSDPAEKDTCPLGSTGTLYLADKPVAYGGDGFSIAIPTCKLTGTFRAAKAPKSGHVAVAMTYDENGY